MANTTAQESNPMTLGEIFGLVLFLTFIIIPAVIMVYAILYLTLKEFWKITRRTNSGNPGVHPITRGYLNRREP